MRKLKIGLNSPLNIAVKLKNRPKTCSNCSTIEGLTQ